MYGLILLSVMILELWCVLYLHEHLKCLVSVKGVFPELVFVTV